MIYLVAFTGFVFGFPLGFMVAVIAKRMFLVVPPSVLTAEQIGVMYKENERIRELNLIAKAELDKLNACGSN